MARNYRRYGRWERQVLKQGLVITNETPYSEDLLTPVILVARDSNGEMVGGFETGIGYQVGFLYADAADMRRCMQAGYEEMCV